MKPQRRDFSDLGDAGYGLAQTGSDGAASLVGQLVVVPAQMAYLHIPATELRNFVDGIFPNLATNKIADSAAGFGHRYRAGHDLLLDIPTTFSSHGPFEGLKHAGHVIFTDFPTKAGIPIPGFSHSGLGHLLEQAGISNGWLQLSLFDTGVGIFAFADSASTLVQAMQGSLSMDFGTACQTFGMGSVELVLGIGVQNPLLATAGLQNVLAGLVSTWNTVSVYVDPLDFLGVAGTSALIGFGMAYGVVGESLSEASIDAARSGTIGALYTVSSAFGFGALAGFIAFRLGAALAQQHNASSAARLSVDENSYRLLLQELCAGNFDVQELLGRTEPKWIQSSKMPFSALRSVEIISSQVGLPTNAPTLDSRPRTLDTKGVELRTVNLALSDDPPDLFSIYRAARPFRNNS